MTNKYVTWFEKVDKNDVGLVGGKGANLGEMTNTHLPIPYGFIVTSHAYFHFIKEARLEKKIRDFLSMINYENSLELQQVSKHIQELILKAYIPEILVQNIIQYYDNLLIKEAEYYKQPNTLIRKIKHRIKHLHQPPLVAVRSSATAEDLPNASFAGQQDTYLNVRGDANLIKKVKECWASLFTPRAIY